MDLIKIFTFDSAHRLPCVADGHKCSNVHGHTFKVEIHLTGQVDKEQAWVIDFADVKTICEPVISTLDHNFLNDIQGLQNPTSENSARWLWNKLSDQLRQLSKIIVFESPESGVAFTKEDVTTSVMN